jgi:hypothetical protein
MIQRTIRAIRGNLVAWLALFVALGGTSLAASHYVIGSTKQINPKVLKKLKGNIGPKGPKGPTGATGANGATGATGATGTVNTSNFFTKSETDARYLAAGAQALDSAQLGGIAASGYTTGQGAQGGRWEALNNKGEEANFVFVPMIGEIGIKCSLEGAKITAIKLTQHAGGSVFYTWASYPEKAVSNIETGLLQNDNESLTQTLTSTEHGGGQMIIQASALASSGDAYADITISVATAEGECRVQANYTVAEPAG